MQRKSRKEDVVNFKRAQPAFLLSPLPLMMTGVLGERHYLRYLGGAARLLAS